MMIEQDSPWEALKKLTLWLMPSIDDDIKNQRKLIYVQIYFFVNTL